MTKATEKKIAREGIAAEKDAVKQYNAMIKKSNDPYVKKVIRHINKEERMHTKEFNELLKRANKMPNTKPRTRKKRSKK